MHTVLGMRLMVGEQGRLFAVAAREYEKSVSKQQRQQQT